MGVDHDTNKNNNNNNNNNHQVQSSKRSATTRHAIVHPVLNTKRTLFAESGYAKLFKDIIYVTGLIAKEGKLQCSEEGIRIQAQDLSRTSYWAVHLKTLFFKNWEVQHRFDFGQSFEELTKLMKTESMDENRMTLVFNGRGLKYCFHSFPFGGDEVSILEISGHTDEEPENNYSRHVKMQSTSFVDLVKRHAMCHTLLNIELRKGCMIWKTRNSYRTCMNYLLEQQASASPFPEAEQKEEKEEEEDPEAEEQNDDTDESNKKRKPQTKLPLHAKPANNSADGNDHDDVNDNDNGNDNDDDEDNHLERQDENQDDDESRSDVQIKSKDQNDHNEQQRHFNDYKSLEAAYLEEGSGTKQDPCISIICDVPLKQSFNIAHLQTFCKGYSGKCKLGEIVILHFDENKSLMVEYVPENDVFTTRLYVGENTAGGL